MASFRIAGRTLTGTVLFFALLMAGGQARSESIPHPELDGLEPAVAEQVRDLRAAVEQSLEENDAARATRYAELGAMYHSLEFTDAALACYRQAEALAPGDGRWPYLQGVLQTDRGDIPAARQGLLRGMALRPELTTGWVRLGRLALDEGEPQEALLHFQRALWNLPESAAAHGGAGQALLELDRPEEAVEHLGKALELEPRANRLHYPLAMAYRALGERHKMQAHLEKVGPIGVTADDPIAEYASNRAAGARFHVQQGNKAYRAGDYAKAVEYYTRATEEEPDEASAWTNLGAAQGAMGSIGAARQSFERALAVAPDNTTALENLASLLMSEGEDAAALSLLNEKMDDDSEHRNLLFRRAELRRLDDDPEGASRDYERLVELAPDQAAAWMGLILSRIEAGSHGEVEQLLAQAGENLDDVSSLKSELIDGLVTVHDGEQANAELAQRLARELYDQDPGSDSAMRVARTLLMNPTGCTDTEQWLEERIDHASSDDNLHDELTVILEQLGNLERCADDPASE